VNENRGRDLSLGAHALVLALLAVAFGAERAGAQAPVPEPADTGWVEIGGEATADSASAGTTSTFGADDPFADLPEEDGEVTRPKGGGFFPYVDYNRVDQWVVGLDLFYRPERGMDPAFKLRVARAFQRKTEGPGDGRMLYNLRLEQPLVPGRTLRAGVGRYRRTDDDRFGQVGGFGNALSTAFFRWDFRDWFEREGFEARLAGEWGARWSGTASWNADDYRSITELADGVAPAFRQDEPLRENPAIDDGRIQAVTLTARFDSRIPSAPPRSGMLLRAQAETAGGALGGDFAYHRYLGDFRFYAGPFPSHSLKTRVRIGTSGHDESLPRQKTFAIGGTGTMRATPFRQFRGNQLFLWNTDWSWEILRRSSRNVAMKLGLSLVAFSDLGLAWDAPSWDASHRQMAWNVGLGAGLTDESLRFYVGRDVRAEHAALHFTVRSNFPGFRLEELLEGFLDE
jgi:hypothetical protein